MRKVLAALAALVLILSLGGTAVAAEPTTVYLVNVLDRTVVDVYMDGNLIIEDFAPGTILGPFVGAFDGQVLIQMIPANTVLGDVNAPYTLAPTAFTTLPAGETVAFVAQQVDVAGWLGALNMFTYDLSPTGPDQAAVMLVNATAAGHVKFVFYPGTPGEQSFTAGSEHHFMAHLPSGPTTAALIHSHRGPNDEDWGTFTADLKPGKLYVSFIYFKFGVGLTALRQEFNVGE
jgi:hypothetical protein